MMRMMICWIFEIELWAEYHCAYVGRSGFGGGVHELLQEFVRWGGNGDSILYANTGDMM